VLEKDVAVNIDDTNGNRNPGAGRLRFDAVGDVLCEGELIHDGVLSDQCCAEGKI
jgi:hypothetical protein